RALNYAINRQQYCRLLGAGSPQFTPTSWSWVTGTTADNPKLTNYYYYDPAKAKALLRQAGYPNGFSLKMLGSSGPNGDPTDAIIVQDLAAVGVKAELTMATSAEVNTDYYSGQYQLSWNGTTYAPAWIDYGFLTSKSSADSSPVSDPVLQRLWQRGIRVP